MRNWLVLLTLLGACAMPIDAPLPGVHQSALVTPGAYHTLQAVADSLGNARSVLPDSIVIPALNHCGAAIEPSAPEAFVAMQEPLDPRLPFCQLTIAGSRWAVTMSHIEPGWLAVWVVRY